MKLRASVAACFAGIVASSLALSAPAGKKAAAGQNVDFKSLMERTLSAWDTLDPATPAAFYAKDADSVFYDVAPLKYTGWTEYAEGVRKVVADWASLKFTLGNDVKTHMHGSLAWGTATWHADIVTKAGTNLALDGRWTVMWEKRGANWVIVHEHMSAPLPAPPSMAGQPLYQRLGGYDALAAVTDDFIGRLAHDPQLGKFFSGHSTASLNHIRQLVVDQLCAATGGPCVYIGRDMKTAHAGLGITEENWNAAANHLVETLDKFKVPKQEKDEVLGAISGFKKDIVEK